LGVVSEHLRKDLRTPKVLFSSRISK